MSKKSDVYSVMFNPNTADSGMSPELAEDASLYYFKLLLKWLQLESLIVQISC